MNELTGTLTAVCELPMTSCIVYRVIVDGEYYNTNSIALYDAAQKLVNKRVKLKWFDRGYGRFAKRFVLITAETQRTQRAQRDQRAQGIAQALFSGAGKKGTITAEQFISGKWKL